MGRVTFVDIQWIVSYYVLFECIIFHKETIAGKKIKSGNSGNQNFLADDTQKSFLKANDTKLYWAWWIKKQKPFLKIQCWKVIQELQTKKSFLARTLIFWYSSSVICFISTQRESKKVKLKIDRVLKLWMRITKKNFH